MTREVNLLTAWFDCFSGVSGDMTLGALLAAGGDEAFLRSELQKLNVSGFELNVQFTSINGIGATDVDVILKEVQGHGRHLHHIAEILDGSSLSTSVRSRALNVFTLLANAEAKVHQTTVERIHFHEVGAVDAIVDIVGACVLLDYLGVDRVVCSPLPMGHGFIDCAHGTIPLPAPAVMEVLQGTPVYNVDVEGELVTPTGAAIVKTLATSFGPMPSMKVNAVGYGSGKKRFGNRPNLLRIVIGDEVAAENSAFANSDTVVLIEANIDDMNPQFFEPAMEMLFANGALDAFHEPIQMKKGRPATRLSVLAKPDDVERLSEIVFRHTTSIGVRYQELKRFCLDRKWESVDTKFGTVRVKLGLLHGEIVNFMPEFEDVKSVATSSGQSVQAVSDAAKSAYLSRQSEL